MRGSGGAGAVELTRFRGQVRLWDKESPEGCSRDHGNEGERSANRRYRTGGAADARPLSTGVSGAGGGTGPHGKHVHAPGGEGSWRARRNAPVVGAPSRG